MKRWSVAWAGAGLAAVIWLAYAGSFSGPLVLDDTVTIGANPSLHRLWPLGPVLAPPPEIPSSGRPLLNLTFALNYAVGGTTVRGYHVVNFLIHLAAAVALFGVVRRTLARPALAARFGARATPLAFTVALLWALHPVQTGAVTYLSQRAEVLMGLCYLLALYGFIRGVDEPGRRRWLPLSVVACALGMAVKEVMVTAPLVILVYDRVFAAGTLAGAWRRRRGYYLALAGTWLLLAGLMLASPVTTRGIGGGGFTGWSYALTQSVVVLRYVGLGLWPHPLVFDYGPDFPVPGGMFAGGCLLLLALIAAATAIAWRRRSGWSFLGGWFFGILLPTSSIVPIAAQPMAESRLYLPLAAVVAAGVLVLDTVCGRRAPLVLLAIGLGGLTGRRNADYQDAATLWADTLAKRPDNSRAHNFYGMSLPPTPATLPAAIHHYEEAVRLRPGFAEAHNNLALALLNLPDRHADALAHFAAALRAKPGYAEVHLNLGSLLAALPGRLDEAIAHYEQALRLRPGLVEAHNNLANALASRPDRLPEAWAHFEAALRLRPDSHQVHNNFGQALRRAPGRGPDAVAHFEAAVRLKPDYALGHLNLGLALADLPGRRPDAITHLQTALRLRPEFGIARDALAGLQAAPP